MLVCVCVCVQGAPTLLPTLPQTDTRIAETSGETLETAELLNEPPETPDTESGSPSCVCVMQLLPVCVCGGSMGGAIQGAIRHTAPMCAALHTAGSMCVQVSEVSGRHATVGGVLITSGAQGVTVVRYRHAKPTAYMYWCACTKPTTTPPPNEQLPNATTTQAAHFLELLLLACTPPPCPLPPAFLFPPDPSFTPPACVCSVLCSVPCLVHLCWVSRCWHTRDSVSNTSPHPAQVHGYSRTTGQMLPSSPAINATTSSSGFFASSLKKASRLWAKLKVCVLAGGYQKKSECRAR